MYNWIAHRNKTLKLIKLIKQLIGLVDNEKAAAKLLKRLEGVEEKPKKSYPYFEAVNRAVSSYNYSTTKSHVGSRVNLMFDVLPMTYTGAYNKAVVQLIRTNCVIAKVEKTFYDVESRQDVLELVFIQMFEIISTHGIANLIDMYQHGYRCDREYDQIQWQSYRQAELEYERNLALSVCRDDRDYYTGATLPSDKDKDLKKLIATSKPNEHKFIREHYNAKTYLDLDDVRSQFIREGDPIPILTVAPKTLTVRDQLPKHWITSPEFKGYYFLQGVEGVFDREGNHYITDLNDIKPFDEL